MKPADPWRESLLHTAARGDDLAALGRILDGVNTATSTEQVLDARDVLGFTPLHVAATEAGTPFVERLLGAGAVVDPHPAPDGLTPLMLAVARGRRAVVDTLLAGGANAGATAVPDLFTMLVFATRGGNRAVLESLVAHGLELRPQEATAYFRLALELLGHGVRYVERGYCRGIAGDTDDVWLVDRPMDVPAALMAPLVAVDAQHQRVRDGLAAETWFHPVYAARFEVSPDRFAASKDLDPRDREPVPVLEVAHEVRCGRHSATVPSAVNDWSPLGRAVTNERAAVVLALVRSAGLDPAALAAESDDGAARGAPGRGLFPVHLDPLRKLLRAALAAER